MRRGRHTSSRDRESDPGRAGEHRGPRWHDDERGTQEWLAEATGPAWLDDPTPSQDAPTTGSYGGVRSPAWDAAVAAPEPEAGPQEQAAFPDSEPPRTRPGREAISVTLDPGRHGRRARASRTRFWRGRRLMALSAVAAVTAVGTVVIGVKLSSSQLELRRAPDCPAGQACAAIVTGKPPANVLPAPTDTEGLTTPDPSGTGSPRASKSAKPSASAGRTPDRSAPVASARPTPDRTRTPTPRPSRTVEDAPEPVPSIEETDTPSPDATPLADGGDPSVSPGTVAACDQAGHSKRTTGRCPGTGPGPRGNR
ncbi:hypothetical protein AB0B89_21085 [Sphaerisporangium sp. NPDC049002]|uniref:hypothetical protein n=1 Tax=Sphaerisporangium sp. NPDC049002 TaxID=3155392 RepID=UPI0033FD8607